VVGLGAPAWLAALAVLPLIRWLHRWQAPLIEVNTGAAFLWQSGPDQQPAAGAGGPPDPAWRLRALFAALVVLALADPAWRHSTEPVTVWVDDSLSMFATENGAPRLQSVLEEVAAVRDKRTVPAVTMCSLSDPAFTISADDPNALRAATWRRGAATRLSPPPSALMDAATAHWLATDGADAQLADWARQAPLERTILVGAATENAAVVRLGARRDTQDIDAMRVLAVVANRGRAPAQRHLNLEIDGSVAASRSLDIPAGEMLSLEFEVATGRDRLAARLEPADALAADDDLAVDIAMLQPLPARLDPDCPAALQRALGSHPGLMMASAPAQAELQVTCGEPPVPGTPALVIHAGPPAPLTGVPEGSPAFAQTEAPRLRRAWIAAAPWPDEGANDGYETLLRAGGIALIRRRTGPLTMASIIETVIDFADPAFANQPEYPALLGVLIDLTMRRAVLDPIPAAERPTGESDIAPLPMPTPSTVATPAIVRAGTPLSPLLLAAAFAALLLDLLRVHRSVRGARRD